ncbi:hypothetical protein EC988_004505 [Linderina pennispora]|nr:hypothetical protein EC988_004505 [Linderina pennispora]
MSTAIASTTALQGPALECNSHSQLLRTTAWSLRSLMRTTDRLASGPGLRGNFGHIIPASATLPSIEVFVNSITASLHIKAAVLVTALVYVERLGRRLPKSAQGTADTPYRIFLAALVLADKYWSDHAVKAKSLVKAAGGLFQLSEICAMERAVLKILGFRLYVSTEELRQYADKLSIDLGQA